MSLMSKVMNGRQTAPRRVMVYGVHRAKQSALQLMVYHADGDLNNCELRNLKTVCLNCAAVLTRQEPLWKRGDLEPDS